MSTLIQDQKRTLVRIGKTIRQLRLSKGMARQRLGQLANIDRSNVGRIERGEINIRIRTLTRIANALNVSIAKLLRDADL